MMLYAIADDQPIRVQALECGTATIKMLRGVAKVKLKGY